MSEINFCFNPLHYLGTVNFKQKIILKNKHNANLNIIKDRSDQNKSKDGQKINARGYRRAIKNVKFRETGNIG